MSAAAASGRRQGIKERLFAHPERPNAAARPAATSRSRSRRSSTAATRPTTPTSPAPRAQRQEREAEARCSKGSHVVAGTILGRVGRPTPGKAAHLNFSIRPAGRGAPLIDPKPILDGWKLLESTAIYRAARPERPLPRTATSIGQILLLPKPLLEKRVLADARIEIYPGGRKDIQTGQIDRRVLATLAYLAESGLRPTVTSLRSGHGFYTSSGNVSHHSSGNAVDIARINGIPIVGHQERGGDHRAGRHADPGAPGDDAPGSDHLAARPRRNTSRDGRPRRPHPRRLPPLFGANKKLGQQAIAVLKPGQWDDLIDRLGRSTSRTWSRARSATRSRRAADGRRGRIAGSSSAGPHRVVGLCEHTFARMVVCLLIPRLALLAALGDKRALLGKPVALAPEAGREQRVGEASAAAEAFGIARGMAMGEALTRCPGLRLVPPDPERERVLRPRRSTGSRESGRASSPISRAPRSSRPTASARSTAGGSRTCWEPYGGPFAAPMAALPAPPSCLAPAYRGLGRTAAKLRPIAPGGLPPSSPPAFGSVRAEPLRRVRGGYACARAGRRGRRPETLIPLGRLAASWRPCRCRCSARDRSSTGCPACSSGFGSARSGSWPSCRAGGGRALRPSRPSRDRPCPRAGHAARPAPSSRAGHGACSPARVGIRAAVGARARAAGRPPARPSRAARPLASFAGRLRSLRGRWHLEGARDAAPGERRPRPPSGGNAGSGSSELPAPAEMLGLEVEAFGPPAHDQRRLVERSTRARPGAPGCGDAVRQVRRPPAVAPRCGSWRWTRGRASPERRAALSPYPVDEEGR